MNVNNIKEKFSANFLSFHHRHIRVLVLPPLCVHCPVCACYTFFHNVPIVGVCAFLFICFVFFFFLFTIAVEPYSVGGAHRMTLVLLHTDTSNKTERAGGHHRWRCLHSRHVSRTKRVQHEQKKTGIRVSHISRLTHARRPSHTRVLALCS